MTTSLKFTDYEVQVSDILPSPSGPMNRSWTRVTFTIPDTWSAPEKVIKWIDDNIPGSYSTSHFTNPKEKKSFQMVVRFKDRNDALMFKLKGGNLAWQEDQ